MQQADMAGSTRSPGASPGKNREFTARPIVLEVAEITRLVPLADQALIQLDRVRTLLRSIDDTVDEAADTEGFWFRQPGYERQRLKHVSALLGLVDDEVGRLSRLLQAEVAA